MSSSVKIQPGLLVGLKSRIIGGYAYKRIDTEARQVGEGELIRWETTKEVTDSGEFKRAAEVRMLATRTIRKTCRNTPFGLICPFRDQAGFRKSITEAQAICEAFNGSAKFSQVTIRILTGEVSDSDEEAIAAIMSEMKLATEEMLAAIQQVNPEAIRQAATRAKELARLLDDDTANKVGAAVKAARKAARAIVKRVEVAGEDARAVLASQNLTPIESLRFTFLDFAEHKPIEGDDVFGSATPIHVEVARPEVTSGESSSGLAAESRSLEIGVI